MTTEKSQLIPIPRRRIDSGVVSRAAENRWVTLVCDGDLNQRLILHLRRCVRIWSDLLGQELQLRVSEVSGREQQDSFLQLLPFDPGLAAGGYDLNIRSRTITLCGADAEGSFRGLMSLNRLLRLQGTNLGCCRYQDHPGFAERGVMLDISRCKVPTLASLKRLIQRLAAFGINQLQLYTEHTFAYSRHPLVWADASPLTRDDILELDEYCWQHFVELVPNQNSFGHMEQWLRHPEYHQYAECPAGFEHPLGGRREFGSTLRPDEKSLRLLAELYDELLPNFRSSRFNLGGDEPWELGKGASRMRCEREGPGRVYADYLNQLHRLVQERGHSTQFWSDFLLGYPDCIAGIDPQMTALNWGYEADHPFEREGRIIRDSGLEYYVCPGTSSWNSLTGRSTNLWKNLSEAARAGVGNQAKGFLITDWGDGGHHQYLPISYPGFALGAALAWNPDSSGRLRPEAAINSFLDLPEKDATGGLLWQLGRTADSVQANPVRNASLFNKLLFGNPDVDADIAHLADSISDADADRCCEQLDALAGQCHQLQGENPAETRLMQAEVHNATVLARIGLFRCKLALASGGGRAALATRIKIRLTEAIAAHEQLWLARNRVGGLHESSRKLRQILLQLN